MVVPEPQAHHPLLLVDDGLVHSPPCSQVRQQVRHAVRRAPHPRVTTDYLFTDREIDLFSFSSFSLFPFRRPYARSVPQGSYQADVAEVVEIQTPGRGNTEVSRVRGGTQHRGRGGVPQFGSGSWIPIVCHVRHDYLQQRRAA